jgi:hypothetical protein
MQTTAAIWLVGGAVCALVYLIGALQAFRKYSHTAGVAIEVYHFGTRAMLVFALWPVVAVMSICIRWGERSRADPLARPPA